MDPIDANLSPLAELLRQLRTKNKYTQEFIAEQLSITRSTYSYYETGKTEPSRTSLGILARLYNVGVECFIFDTAPTLSVSSNKVRATAMARKIPSNITTLSTEERQLIAKYRLASTNAKEKIIQQLEKKDDEK